VKIVAVVGNPNPASRTFHIAKGLAERLGVILDSDQLIAIDLAQFAEAMFTWPHDALSDIQDEVASSDVLVAASPVYKGTYSGLLKAFFDRYPTDGLAGVTAIPVMSGGSALHALAPEIGLRPLLIELGASVPTRSLFFPTPQFSEVGDILDKWVSSNVVANAGLFGPIARNEEPS